MPILNRSFRERDPVKVGVAGLLAAVLLGIGLFNAGSLIGWFTSRSYTAQFTDVGTLKTGDDVRLAGVKVGSVSSIHIDGDFVDVKFTVSAPGDLGDTTRAAIKSATALGAKYLGVLPAGTGPLGATIPASRTQAPYDITEALSTLTGISTQLNKDTLAQSMHTIATTFADTPPELRSAIDGVGQLSHTIGARDQALRELLAHSNAVTGVLADRSVQLATLLGDGNLLLTELDRRRQVIQQLLVSVTATIEQLNGLVEDNQRQLGPALEELHHVLDLLNKHADDIAATIHGVRVYATSLNEAVGAGPWFFAMIPNLPPTNLVPVLPTVLGQGK